MRVCITTGDSEMNFLDIVIIFVFAILIMLGFFGGVGRVIAGFLGVYFGTIVAAAVYESISEFITDHVKDMRSATADLIAFMVVLALVGVLFYFAFNAAIARAETHTHRL